MVELRMISFGKKRSFLFIWLLTWRRTRCLTNKGGRLFYYFCSDPASNYFSPFIWAFSMETGPTKPLLHIILMILFVLYFFFPLIMVNKGFVVIKSCYSYTELFHIYIFGKRQIIIAFESYST